MILLYIRAAAPAADPGKESGIAGGHKTMWENTMINSIFLDFATVREN